MQRGGALQELLLLHLIDHPRVKQLLHKHCLLAEHGHGGSVGLYGLEALRRFHLALQDEAPDLQRSEDAPLETCLEPLPII